MAKKALNQLSKSNRGNTNKAASLEKTIHSIAESYIHTQHSIVNQLTLETPNHHLTTGTTRERVWLKLFESMVPKKFYIDQGVFIIDSFGNISAEVDLAIFDEQYTPYIFKFENIKFIPIEAVAVAVQCKSKNVAGITKWAASIKKLKTSHNSFYRVMPGILDTKSAFENGFVANQNYDQSNPEAKRAFQSQTSTRPILILCTSVEKAKVTAAAEKSFDIVLSVNEGGRLKKTIRNEQEDYRFWYEQLNHYDHTRYTKEGKMLSSLIPKNASGKDETGRKLADLSVKTFDENEENVLLSLTFQLNQLLMLINNPMAFPHQAYAEKFKKNYEKFRDTALAVKEEKNTEGEQ